MKVCTLRNGLAACEILRSRWDEVIIFPCQEKPDRVRIPGIGEIKSPIFHFVPAFSLIPEEGTEYFCNGLILKIRKVEFHPEGMAGGFFVIPKEVEGRHLLGRKAYALQDGKIAVASCIFVSESLFSAYELEEMGFKTSGLEDKSFRIGFLHAQNPNPVAAAEFVGVARALVHSLLAGARA